MPISETEKQNVTAGTKLNVIITKSRGTRAERVGTVVDVRKEGVSVKVRGTTAPFVVVWSDVINIIENEDTEDLKSRIADKLNLNRAMPLSPALAAAPIEDPVNYEEVRRMFSPMALVEKAAPKMAEIAGAALKDTIGIAGTASDISQDISSDLTAAKAKIVKQKEEAEGYLEGLNKFINESERAIKAADVYLDALSRFEQASTQLKVVSASYDLNFKK